LGNAKVFNSLGFSLRFEVTLLIKVGFLKLGNIATAPLIEFLLDERAEREDIDVRVLGSGAKLGESQAEEVAKKMLEISPDLVILISPNAALPGPTKAREILATSGKPVIVVSDAPAKKAVKRMEQLGVGYIIIEADPMIGARREFLDPVEMALFNSDMIKVLGVTGVFNIVYEEIDKVIEALKKGEKPELPRVIINKEIAVEAAKFHNPYALTKAMAAYEIARQVAELSVEGCFKVKEWKRYVKIVAAAHEMARIAAKLAEEAREIEKSQDTVIRRPHHDDGAILMKRKLIEKPRRQET